MTWVRLKSLLALGLTCAITFAFICSFLLVKASDEAAGLIGNQVVLIQDSTGKTTAEEFRSHVTEYAQHNNIDIFLTISDPNSPQTKRILYIAPASPTSTGTQWLQDGYPTFSNDAEMIVRHLSDYHVNDPRGFYYIDGPQGAGQNFFTMAKGYGMDGTQPQLNGFDYLRTESAALTIVVILVLLVAMSAIHIIIRSRHLAIATMIGQRTTTFVCREIINASTERFPHSARRLRHRHGCDLLVNGKTAIHHAVDRGNQRSGPRKTASVERLCGATWHRALCLWAVLLPGATHDPEFIAHQRNTVVGRPQ